VQDAYLPDYKSGPKRAVWAVGAAFLTLVLINGLLITRAIYTGEIKSEKQRLLKEIVESLLCFH
jgi:uncharacterized protein involved in exopolysaccharide biosynthesis